MADKNKPELVLVKLSTNFLPSSQSILSAVIQPEDIGSVERYELINILVSFTEVEKVTDKSYFTFGSRNSKDDLGVIKVDRDVNSVSISALVSNKKEFANADVEIYKELISEKVKSLISEAREELLEALLDIRQIEKSVKIESNRTNFDDLLVD